MAQKKGKRRTKHRGTQAGTVESRGRTSRPRSRAQAREQALQRRQNQRVVRANVEPNWRSAITRAGIAAGLFLVVLLVMKQPPVSSVFIAVLMFVLYIPMGFYMDSFLYKRRLATEARKREQD